MASESFWEVLAGRLHDRPAGPAAACRRGSPVRQTWDPGLRFVLLGGGVTGDAHVTPVASPASMAALTVAWSDALESQARRPGRFLTEGQRAAFDVLRASGASGLTEDFTAADLRSAYRRLALRWHPDRHATAAPAERALLAQTFARITSAYRQLAGHLRQAA